ncbi:Clp protease ClpP [Flavobacterium sp. LS1R47]|uniref:ATP-dependent Clp protease proteolytic subunit n=1 Tax=Flavobacterium frigoritolerans TaxID=2987686 RepID=A0A9X3CAF6_9FLAO|nr:head maturation protease, ClpP-related [Flavobacterium frigoritolerans]MCV9934541.1 Clp protease ClpP [Flavobacterium frigoritolerans]
MQFQFIKNQVEVKAHGDIYPYDISNNDFIKAIALAKEKKSILFIDVHCFGGSVIEGNLIYNTLINAGVKKHLDITGIAASMATVMMMAADKVRMNDDSFIMLHRPTCAVEGDAEELQETAKVLTSMSGTMGKRYSEKSGKTIDEVNALWLNGKDNWMDATEALEAGLIDEIIVTGRQPISKVEVLANTKGIFEKFTARLNVPAPNLKKTDMKKDLIASLKLEGVNEASTEQEIIEAIKKQRTTQDATILDLQKKAEDDKEKAIDDLLEEAATAEQITAEQKVTYKEVGKALGIDKMKAMLPAGKKLVAPNARLDLMIKSTTTGNTAVASVATANGAFDISAKSWDELAAQSGALESIEENKPEVFAALYKAKWGTEIK